MASYSVQSILPTPLSVIFASASWCAVTWQKERMDQLERQRIKIDNRLKRLYGPLYGNRMLHNAGIRAIEKRERLPLTEQRSATGLERIQFLSDQIKKFNSIPTSVTEYIGNICEDRNSEALQNWRGYYKRQLMVLDEKAEKIILAHSDCFISDESSDIINQFVEQIAEHSYNTELWRAGKKNIIHILPRINFFILMQMGNGIQSQTMSMKTSFPRTTILTLAFIISCHIT